MFEDDRLCPNCGWKMETEWIGSERSSPHWECKNPDCRWDATLLPRKEKWPEVRKEWESPYSSQRLKVERIEEKAEYSQHKGWWVFSSPILRYP